jgi:murein DD-endopeptidase MepM/ murein hydrolase activator NlpD
VGTLTLRIRTSVIWRTGPRTVSFARMHGPWMRAAALVALMLTAGACSVPRWPVEGTTTSTYGLRMRGMLPRMHHGYDIAAPEGTPVRTMHRGVVEFAGAMGGYGNVIIIRHGRSVQTLYAHLARIDVAAGDRLQDRQQIGTVGRTGNATGPHLHFEILRWGRSDDPEMLLGGRPGGR